jgi:isoleucyl-tRNA synthetase
VERLVIAEGSVSASAHKNPYNPLHLDWNFGIGFQPLELGGSTYETALGVDGQKCERCWHWETDVGQHVEHPTLCARCVEAVKASGQA